MSLLESGDLLHRRVFRAIADEIARGALRPGERLPPERDLCERLGVSRTTVRRALRELADEGLIESHVGRGSFVVGEVLDEAPNALMSFTELGESRGLSASARVLDDAVRPATIDEAETLGVAPGSGLFVLERVRLLDGLPVALDRSRVPLARAPRLPKLDFASASLYGALRDAGAAPVRADYTVQALPADKRRAKVLDVPVGAPLLLTETVAFDRNGQVVELSEMAYRGDRYRFHATLVRRS